MWLAAWEGSIGLFANDEKGKRWRKEKEEGSGGGGVKCSWLWWWQGVAVTHRPICINIKPLGCEWVSEMVWGASLNCFPIIIYLIHDDYTTSGFPLDYIILVATFHFLTWSEITGGGEGKIHAEGKPVLWWRNTRCGLLYGQQTCVGRGCQVRSVASLASPISLPSVHVWNFLHRHAFCSFHV